MENDVFSGVLTKHQQQALDDAKEVSQRGLYWCPSSIAGHSAARALARRGLLFVVDGVRHEETGHEGRGYGVVGVEYP